jgi:cytochrome o ubiquinol oxidase subunit 1
MPRNSPTGLVTAFFAVITGFALIWHIWWMAGVGLIGATVTLLAFMFRAEDEVRISAEQVALFDRAHLVEVSL